MKEIAAFDEVRTRTPRAQALVREKLNRGAVRSLLEVDAEEAFKQLLADKFNLTPGQPHYDEALSAWREAQALK